MLAPRQRTGLAIPVMVSAHSRRSSDNTPAPRPSKASVTLPHMTERRLDSLSLSKLFALNRATLRELVRRGVVRTRNAPQGDYAELLVATAYGGELAPNSEKSWDVRTSDGRRLQVKARTVGDGRPIGSKVTSPFRSWAFDAAVIVLLSDEDLSVVEAAEIPVKVVREVSQWRAHVNGSVLTPTPQVLARGLDVTERLRAAAEST